MKSHITVLQTQAAQGGVWNINPAFGMLVLAFNSLSSKLDNKPFTPSSQNALHRQKNVSFQTIFELFTTQEFE